MFTLSSKLVAWRVNTEFLGALVFLHEKETYNSISLTSCFSVIKARGQRNKYHSPEPAVYAELVDHSQQQPHRKGGKFV